jgi:hypothetical protein
MLHWSISGGLERRASASAGFEGGILELRAGCSKQIDKRDFIATFDDPCYLSRRHNAWLD